jgi:phosphoglycolate phosphatase-like HAD superfamily hydrolase
MPLAIVTGRPRSDALRFLEEQGIAPLFRAVVTREDAPLKPSPEPVRVALERLGVPHAWMIGDTPDDLVAARAAGVVPIGNGADAPTLTRAGAARVVTRLAEIEEILP